MQRLRILLTLLLLFVGSGIAWTGLAHAQTFSRTTDSSQTINSSLYSAAQSVNIEGTINGDVYCAGQTVTIDATVHGDVICAGQRVTVQGHIDGSLRVVAQDVTDQATVGGNYSAAAHYAVITKNARVGGDASFAGQYLAVNGHVGRDVVAKVTKLDINGAVGRNVKYDGTTLNVWSQARITGALHYTAPHNAMIAKSAVVGGKVTHNQPPKSTQSVRSALAQWAGSFMYIFVAMLLFGLLVVLLMPQTVRTVSEEGMDHSGKALLNSLVLLVLEPVIVIILLSIVFGIPLAVISVLLFVLLGFCSVPVTAYIIGMYVMSRHDHALLTMTVGMFVLILLIFIPVLGILAVLGSYLLGSGAIILALRKYLPTPVYKVK